MAEYRAYIVGPDGHFKGYEGLVCNDDAQAIDQAKRLVDGHDVEIWSGARFVTRLNTNGKTGAISHEIINGRMVPKK
jgi:hypothetical protein